VNVYTDIYNKWSVTSLSFMFSHPQNFLFLRPRYLDLLSFFFFSFSESHTDSLSYFYSILLKQDIFPYQRGALSSSSSSSTSLNFSFNFIQWISITIHTESTLQVCGLLQSLETSSKLKFKNVEIENISTTQLIS